VGGVGVVVFFFTLESVQWRGLEPALMGQEKKEGWTWSNGIDILNGRKDKNQKSERKGGKSHPRLTKAPRKPKKKRKKS